MEEIRSRPKSNPGALRTTGIPNLAFEKRPLRFETSVLDRRKKPERSAVGGFTLLELLVVLVLISLLTALVFPSMGRGIAALRLKTGSRDIAATLRLARSKAINEQKIYWVGFDLERNQVELSSDDQRYQKFFQLPEGITISKVTSAGAEVLRGQQTFQYYFEPNGMAQAFEVQLRNGRGQGMKILQNPFVRSPRLERLASESSGILVIR
jgi:general secretion pathway protein H